MPTDENINAELDQVQPDSDHDDGAVDDFNARKASKTLAEKLTKLESRYEAEIAELKAKLSGKPEELETTIVKKAEEIISKKSWFDQNQARIDLLSEENKKLFEEKSGTMSLEDALAIAESKEPYKVTKESVHPPFASVSRDTSSLSESEKADAAKFGFSEEAILIHKQLKAKRTI